jgi:hypothetical protein
MTKRCRITIINKKGHQRIDSAGYIRGVGIISDSKQECLKLKSGKLDHIVFSLQDKGRSCEYAYLSDAFK